MSDDGEGARENVGAFEFQINHHDPDHPNNKRAEHSLPAPLPPPPALSPSPPNTDAGRGGRGGKPARGR